MNVIVVGCGRVGSQLATLLSVDGHNVTVIDKESDSFRRLGTTFNGITIRGLGFDEDVLEEAGIRECDAFAAVTDLDNTNLMAAEVARKIFDVPHVVARLYNPQRERTYQQLDLDYVCGTTLVAESLLDKIKSGHGHHIDTFGDVEIVVFKLAALVVRQEGRRPRHSRPDHGRHHRARQPYVHPDARHGARGWRRPARRDEGRRHAAASPPHGGVAVYIVVNGGGKVGSYLARTLLESGHDVAVIEKREDIVEKLVNELPKRALIIQGDGCDATHQEDAGVARADVFTAVAGDDDDNLVACQLAKVAFGVPRAISRVNNPKNEHIFNALGIEAISSTNIISRMVEEEATVGDIRTLATLRKGNMAIVEIELPEDRCVVCNKPVSSLKLPPNCVLVAVVRADDQAETVHGETLLGPGDTVIAFTSVDSERALKRVLTGE